MLTCAALVLSLSATPAPADPSSVIAGLSRRVEQAEDQLQRDIEDLARLDTCAAAATCHDALRSIERLARALEEADLSSEERRSLRVAVFDQLEYARYRLHEVEACAIGAAQLSVLLAGMRDARAAGRPDLAVALHLEQVGDARPSGSSPGLLRRLDKALTEERCSADAALAEPGTRPLAAPR